MTDTPTERGADSTWTRLRRRKVVQWGLLYVAGAWGFLQGLEYVSESFHWPEQFRQIALLAFLIGLPVVLVLAWYHGDRGEQRFRGTEVAIIALLFLVGGGIFWRYDRASDASTSADNAAALAVTAASPQPAALPDAKSIAVLPFIDMSSAKDQEYMSDGIAEEFLNLLAKVPDLKVIARTSSFAFKGEKVEIAEIAKRLNVAHVLEGSVRTSGNKLRITAQLIRTVDSTHLWSETYDRPLDDIFAVQDEIASAIVQALQLRLMGGTLDPQQGGTENLEAYELYLRAWNGEDWATESSLDAAAKYLEQAIELDPTFSRAWSALANLYGVKAEHGYLDAKEAYERARAFTQHALELNPNSAHAHSELGSIHFTHDWDWAAADRETQRALAIDPTDPGVLNLAGRLSIVLRRWADAERQLRAALVRDPLSVSALYNLGLAYYLTGRFNEAEGTARKLLAISPGFPWIRVLLSQTLLLQGKADEALALIKEDPDEQMRLVSLPIILRGAGRQDEADMALRAQIEHWRDSGPSYIALSYAHRGEYEAALKWLDEAYERKDPALIEVLGDPLFGSMLDDPRYKAFLRKMKLPEWPTQAIAATGK